MPESESDRLGPQVTLVEKDGRFYLFDSKLAVIGSGDGIEEAYKQFIQRRDLYVSDVEKAGMASIIFAPPPKAMRMRVLAELSMFLAKTVLVILVLAGLGAWAIAPLSPLSMSDVADKVWDMGVDMQGMKDEQRRKLSLGLGEVSRQLRPLGDIWRNPPKEPLDPSAIPPRKVKE